MTLSNLRDILGSSPRGAVPTNRALRRASRFSGLAPAFVLLVACCLAVAGLVASPSSAFAATGTITGTVVNESGDPEGFATVLLDGTSLGAQTNASGEFTIKNVPPGTYTLKVIKMGFDQQRRENVSVVSGETVTLKFTMKETAVAEMNEVQVFGKKELIDKKSSTVRQSVGKDDLASLPVDQLTDAIGLKAGVVSQAGELHFRGGRSGEVQYQIDGIPVKDPLSGGNVEVATNAVSDSEVLLGGFDAEYGNAQSGIVNIQTQEGGSRFAGNVTYSTDDFGAPDKTYDNFDRLEVGFGGPTGVRDLTYFMSIQGTFDDGYLKTSERRPRQTILDFIKVGPRQNNDFKYQGKLAWKPGPNYKLTFEYLNNQADNDLYSHVFSLNGFVQVRVDTVRSTGQIRTLYGRFSAEQEDSTFVPYNAAEHTPDTDRGFNQLKMIWNHTLSQQTFYTLKLSRHQFDLDQRIRGKNPWQYITQNPGYWRNQIDGTTNEFFATNGDYPDFTTRKTVTWTMKSDITHKVGRHRFKSGIEAIYNDLQLLNINYPVGLVSQDGKIGGVRSEYHYYNPEGSFYAQDQWEHEGMVINAGGRLDVFSVGSQLDVSEVQQRSRNQLSPRFGIAYPISDRDVFSFHYGRFSQIPDRQYIFENRGASTQVRGNPNLENETTVSYQAALQHMFSPDVFGQFSVYFKDIFGLLTIDRLASGDNPQLVDTYVNKDYASARGFEVTLQKRFTHNFSGELSYGYGIATGVASDPNQQRNTQLLYLPISEQPLAWDQRHTFSANMLISQPEDWLANFVWTFGSGFPFTPTPRNQRKVDPAKQNAGRLPSVTNLSIQAEKHYRMWGQDVKVFFRGNNVLDATNISDLTPQNWPPPPGVNVDDYEVFYTETGRAGGAYLGDDNNADGIEDWIPVNDPRVFQEGRNLRVGLGVKF